MTEYNFQKPKLAKKAANLSHLKQIEKYGGIEEYRAEMRRRRSLVKRPGLKKKTELAKAKDKAWKAFSLFIRTRDSIKTTGGLEGCLCVSCGDWRPRLGMYCIQAGHFISGRSNAVLFSEEGVHGQCQMCNHGVKGRNKPTTHINYYRFMENTYGKDFIDKLILESNQTVKYKVWDFVEKEVEYTLKTKELIEKLKPAGS